MQLLFGDIFVTIQGSGQLLVILSGPSFWLAEIGINSALIWKAKWMTVLDTPWQSIKAFDNFRQSVGI